MTTFLKRVLYSTQKGSSIVTNIITIEEPFLVLYRTLLKGLQHFFHQSEEHFHDAQNPLSCYGFFECPWFYIESFFFAKELSKYHLFKSVSIWLIRALLTNALITTVERLNKFSRPFVWIPFNQMRNCSKYVNLECFIMFKLCLFCMCDRSHC